MTRKDDPEMRLRRAPLTTLGTAVVAVVALLAGCGTIGGNIGAVAQPKTGKPIVFGISLSLTGGFVVDGQAFQRGYRLWQAAVNSHGGILGRPVKLIILDDKSSPTKVVANYKQLITVDHVDMTLGPFSSLLTGPAAVAVGAYHYAMIEGAGAATSVFQAPNNKYHNVFCPSLPVKDYMAPLINWMKKLPVSQRPKTASYPTANDPFASLAIEAAKLAFQAMGIKTVYSSPGQGFTEVPKALSAPATAVVAKNAQMVVLGSTAVPTVAAFMKVFETAHYNPKLFIAFSGPDQGAGFLNPVGLANAEGVMVPGGWFGGYNNPLSNAMVEQYIARYGGTAPAINADVAEAYSVGEIAADAISATGGARNTQIIRYLHARHTLSTRQGEAQVKPPRRNPPPAAVMQHE